MSDARDVKRLRQLLCCKNPVIVLILDALRRPLCRMKSTIATSQPLTKRFEERCESRSPGRIAAMRKLVEEMRPKTAKA